MTPDTDRACRSLINAMIQRGVRPSEIKAWPEKQEIAAAVDPRIATRLPPAFAGHRVVRRPWAR